MNIHMTLRAEGDEVQGNIAFIIIECYWTWNELENKYNYLAMTEIEVIKTCNFLEPRLKAHMDCRVECDVPSCILVHNRLDCLQGQGNTQERQYDEIIISVTQKLIQNESGKQMLASRSAFSVAVACSNWIFESASSTTAKPLVLIEKIYQ